jgi:hypothetical protein
MGSDEDIPENKLLDMPSEGIAGLSRVWIMRSGLIYQKLMTELAAERSGNARPFMLFPDRDPKHREEEERRRALLAYEQAMQEVRDHADRLLLRLDEQQHEIDRRRKEMEGRALHLHDGRRVWIDGDQYRDDEGFVLQGRDFDEADALAHQHPDAATWAERKRLQKWQEDTDRLREKVVHEREGEGDPEAAQQQLKGYENELEAQMEERRKEIASAPVDYGDADYTGLLVPSSSLAFNAAAAGEVSSLRVERKETDSASADNHRVSRPPTQTGPKL